MYTYTRFPSLNLFHAGLTCTSWLEYSHTDTYADTDADIGTGAGAGTGTDAGADADADIDADIDTGTNIDTDTDTDTDTDRDPDTDSMNLVCFFYARVPQIDLVQLLVSHLVLSICLWCLDKVHTYVCMYFMHISMYAYACYMFESLCICTFSRMCAHDCG